MDEGNIVPSPALATTRALRHTLSLVGVLSHTG